MHAPATESTIKPRSRRNPSSHALRPLVSPLPSSNTKSQTLGSVKPQLPAQSAGGGTGTGTGSKPIMDWFRKLGHGMRLDPPGAGTRGSTMSRPTMGRGGKSSKDKSFRAQASSSSNGKALGKVGRDQQMTASSDAVRRRSSHHRSASVKSSKSICSGRLIPPFSPPYASSHAQIPRAETFMTRSSRSPASSLISSDDGSGRSSTEHSLAASYLDVNDPDARSFVPSVMADEDASLRPFPPSPGRSSVPHSTRRSSVAPSISSTDGIRAASRHENLSPLRPSQHMRRDSQSTTATTYSSFGAPSRTWTNDGVSRTRSVDTRPTTILGSLDFLPQRAAHIAQAVPPSVTPAPTNTVRGGSQIHRTLTWDSGLSASPSVPSPLGTSVTANQTGQQQLHRRSILERPLERTSPASSSPPSTNSVYPCHVPRHSHPHPRDNPRPFAPPEANASLVTLASSEFAQPGRAREEADILGPPLELATPRLGAHEYDLTLDQDEEQYRYVAEQKPINDATSSSHHRAVSYFDRTSGYYFNPTSNPATTTGGRSSSINTGAPGTTHLGNASLRSHDDRSGWDDRASVTAMRRRGSWESGESSFSGAGRTGVALNGVQRGSFSLASAHARYSPSLNPPLRDGAAGEIGGTGGLASLSQSLKRMSVAEGPENAVEEPP